jgi:hypothetical protein
VLIPGSTGYSKEILLRSLNGLPVRNIDVPEAEVSKKIYVGDLPKGLYIFELVMKETIYRTKLIIQ